MRRWSIVPVIAGVLVALVVHPSLAAERTAVFQANLTVPILGTQSIGVLTVVYDDTTGEGSWTFDGTIDGQPASASGRGVSVVDGSAAPGEESRFSLTMTAIETWDMSGFDPVVPRTATIRSAGALAYVNYDGPVFSLLAIPVAIDPSLQFPIEGVYVLTNAGSGDDMVEEIPRTGVGPTSGSGSGFEMLIVALLIIAAGLMAMTLSIGTPLRALHQVRLRSIRDVRRDVD